MTSAQAAFSQVHDEIKRRLLVANVTGGVALFAYLQVSLRPEASGVPGEAWFFFSQLVVLCPIGMLAGHVGLLRATRWVREHRPPSDAEKDRLLREPWRQAMRPLVLWVAAATINSVGAAAAGYRAREVFQIADAILLGGFVTCSLTFLLIERSFGPLFAIALQGEPPSRPSVLGIRPRLLLAWTAGSAVPLLGVGVGPMIDGAPITHGSLLVLSALGLGAGLVATVAVARTLALPLDELRDALARLRAGDLSASVAVDDGGEVGEVQAGFNRLAAGLREREQLRQLFGAHVGEEVAAAALEHGTGLGGEQRDASIVFVDLIGSTAMAEVMPPGEVVETLNDFFEVVVRAVRAEGGWVNKFEGDGALCVFGVPGTQPDHAARALRAARAVRAGVLSLRERHPGLDAGIGVSSGAVVAGNVGAEERYEYTVIGPAVNEAARLTDLAKRRQGKVLATSAALARSGDERSSWSGVGTVALKGKPDPVGVFEPLVAAPVDALFHPRIDVTGSVRGRRAR